MPIRDSEARREYMREWSRKRRIRNRKLIQEYKVKQGCKDCGYNAHHAALEFDHIADDKVANVANLMGQEKALWAEIAKCEVVCSNCHSIRTFNRLGPLV
jgi:hypothetical protein